ncbi:MAG: glutamate 5-kinase [Wenzhouxiangellaceae bacterium]
MNRIWVVKLGTHVIAGEQGIDGRVLGQLAEQVRACHEAGIGVVLVSSGAVRAGLESLPQPAVVKDEISRRQLLSALGQVALMQAWQRHFKRRGLHCAQVLATKADFRDRRHYLNMQNCLRALLSESVVPIVNENDVVAVSELMFTDNDELAGMLAAMLDADKLVLLSNIRHVLRTVGDEVQPIHEWQAADQALVQPQGAGKSQFGRGGIHTKLRVALRSAALGIEVWIGDGRTRGILQQIAAGQADATRFPAAREHTAVKRWVANSAGYEKAVIVVNDGARAVLSQPGRLVSLLPVGVSRFEGDFAKGDIVRIEDEQGRALGLGKAQYGAIALRRRLGKQQQKALIHYDYLYIDHNTSPATT